MSKSEFTELRPIPQFNIFKPRFHPGQMMTLDGILKLNKRIVLLSCGTQGGKSLVGSYVCSLWGDKYKDGNIVVTAPTFPIMSQSTFVALENLLPTQGWEYAAAQDRKYWYRKGCGVKIYVRTGTNPEAIEGIPNVIGIWADEAGQMSRHFWTNLDTRTSYRQCPVLLTTTPYTPVWVLNEIIRPIEKDGKIEEIVKNYKGIYQKYHADQMCNYHMREVTFLRGEKDEMLYINYPSYANPTFPYSEIERQKRRLDPLLFMRRYEGKYTRLLGLVYGDYGKHLWVDPFPFPHGTQFYAGVDWGYSNDPFAVEIRAYTPDKLQYTVKAFKGLHKSISDKIQILKGFHSQWPFVLSICDKAEPADIAELNKAGLPAVACRNWGTRGRYVKETGVSQHVELVRSGRYRIINGAGEDLDDEYSTYIRDPDTGKLIDGNDDLMDAIRYVTEYLSQFDTPEREQKYIDPVRTDLRFRKEKGAWEI